MRSHTLGTIHETNCRISEQGDEVHLANFSFGRTPAYFLPCSFLRTRLVVRALNNAIAFSLPVLSSVASIVTYAVTGHELDAGILFSSLALFTLLRVPLQFLRTSEITRYTFLFIYQGGGQKPSLLMQLQTPEMLSNVSKRSSSQTSRAKIIGGLTLNSLSRFA